MIITVGVFSLLEKEISIQVLAALLSIIGYSLNDTIIIYDRIRENSVHMKNLPKTEMINKSINDTLSRTILTTLTLIMAIVCIYVFGGEVMSDFALAMGIGMVVGTYSTVYVAAPLTLLFNKWFK